MSSHRDAFDDVPHPADTADDAESGRAQGPRLVALGTRNGQMVSPHWQADLLAGRNGPKKCLANVMHVLSLHPAWEGVLAYDAFGQCAVKRQAPPTRTQDGTGTTGEWSEADSVRTAAWFAQQVGFEPTPPQVDQAVSTIAQVHTFHPVRDYLNALRWDGEPRLDSMLHRYFMAANTPYARAVSSRWMISAVARVMDPGCQADCMLVLEGEQGLGKSTSLEVLAGSDWFAETGINLGDKDSYQSLRRKWVYEFGELDAIKGREITRVKSFISARKDTYRPSYGRRCVDFPRQVVFAGSTNEAEYLVDPTGARRFWPVRCNSVVDRDALARDRDQLWAEAVVRYRRREPWHLDTASLQGLALVEQRAREQDEPWLERIESYLGGLNLGAADKGVTTADVMSSALFIEPERQNRAAATRIGTLLRRLGWSTESQEREGAARVRRYRKVQLAQPQSVQLQNGCDEAKLPTAQLILELSQPSQPNIVSTTSVQRAVPAVADEHVHAGRDAKLQTLETSVDTRERAAIADEGCGEL